MRREAELRRQLQLETVCVAQCVHMYPARQLQRRPATATQNTQYSSSVHISRRIPSLYKLFAVDSRWFYKIPLDTDKAGDEHNPEFRLIFPLNMAPRYSAELECVSGRTWLHFPPTWRRIFVPTAPLKLPLPC